MTSSRLVLLSASLFASLLTGCALQQTATDTSAAQAVALSGKIHGGQQAVSGAHVFLLAASSGTYAGPGIAAATANRSASLLTAGDGIDSTANSPTNGFRYVTTDADGNFTITTDYTCTSGQLVYLLATGGNTGSGTNSSSGFLSILGSCPGTTFPSTTRLYVSEVTTASAAYALAGFATDATHISSGASALSKTGLANAFAVFPVLVNPTSGVAYSANPVVSGGTVPQAKINTLANILAACVNATDAAPANCTTLFGAVKSAGTSGTAATDVATEAIYLAQNPITAIATTYGLQAAAGAPFLPDLTTQPTDLTLALTFPTIKNNANDSLSPSLPGIDAAGDVVIPADGYSIVGGFGLADSGGNLIVLSNLGVLKRTPTRLEDPSFAYILQLMNVAIDPFGYAWLANGAMNSVIGGRLLKINIATGAQTNYTPSQYTSTSNGVVSDASGNILVADTGNKQADVFNNSGVYQSAVDSISGVPTGLAIDSSNFAYAALPGISKITEQYIGATGASTQPDTNGPDSVALDSSANLWVTNGGNNSISYYPISRTLVGNSSFLFANTSTPYTGGGLSFNTTSQPLIPIVMDGASAAWIPNFAGNSITGFSNSGTTLTPAANGSFTGGFQTGCPSKGVAIDGSGNIWVTCDIGPNLTGIPLIEFIGAATPVATPILPTQQGTRP